MLTMLWLVFSRSADIERLCSNTHSRWYVL